MEQSSPKERVTDNGAEVPVTDEGATTLKDAQITDSIIS